MARIAASWMFSGVGKSGSPSAKSSTLTPCDFNRFASAAIAMVADGAIKLDLSASVRGIGAYSLELQTEEPPAQHRGVPCQLRITRLSRFGRVVTIFPHLNRRH